MVQTFIEVTLKNGTVTDFPIENLDNFKRLNGHNITSIKPKKNGNDFTKPVIVTTAKTKKTK
jgi:hypothetical protein